MVLITVLCHHCHSDQVIKGGKTKAGQQRYKCQNTDCPRCAPGSNASCVRRSAFPDQPRCMTSSSGCLSIAMSLDCWYETVKCISETRPVEIPQQLIERAVFHHQHHDVVKGRQILPLVGDAEQRTSGRPVARAGAPSAIGDRRPGYPDKRPARESPHVPCSRPTLVRHLLRG